MSDSQTVSMEPRRFVTAAVNLLHAAFIKASRAQAKRHFARVLGGGALDMATLKLDDGSELLFRVALDHQEYRGRLSFTAFRHALPQLLARLAERVRMKKGDLNIYTSEETGSLLFNVPAIITLDGQTNVLMLGVDKPEVGVASLRLQFLDPTQFQKPAETA